MSLNKTQRNKLKKLLHQACIGRDKKCLWCGKVNKTLSASHIYPKGRYPHMQWDLDNVKTLCYYCHIHRWHKEPVEAARWITEALPMKRLQKLEEMAQEEGKHYYDYEEIKSKLEKDGKINR